MGITVAALADIGLEARAVAWDDTSVDWSACAGVVVRSTWDYHRRLDEFMAWIDIVDRHTHLENRPEVLQWNIDKHYLMDIARGGLPVIETVFVEPPGGHAFDDSDDDVLARVSALAAHGDVVVKPVVSAGSTDTRRHGDLASARAHIDELVARGRAVMVQPYLAQVDVDSETGLVYIDGAFSHAFSKGPMLAAPGTTVGTLYLAEVIGARTPTSAQRDLGDRVMAWLERTWGTPLYARVDLLPTSSGPVIIEVELCEPSLYLHLDAQAPARFAAAIARRFAGAQPS